MDGSGVGSYRTRVCPCCGEKLYADMRTCYGCLYDFDREKGLRPAPVPTGPEDAATGGQGVAVRLVTPSVDVAVGVPEEGVVVGRSAGCDVVLHSWAVSEEHLRLVPTPDGMEVTDLGATNPARYRGSEVRGSVIAPYGDAIEVCGSVLVMLGPERAGER